ncbi:MAG: DUF445 domain-containing protein, partial [Bacteroidota bacterium]
KLVAQPHLMLERLGKYLSRHFSPSSLLALDFHEDLPESQPMQRKRWRDVALWMLKVVPWVCLAGFGLHWVWDFGPEDQIVLFGQTLVLENFILTLSISGLIGYGTNYLAIRMLFQPQQRRPIWGQGLIPANKDRIAHKLAVTINDNILNEEHIKERLHEAAVVEKLSANLQSGVKHLFEDEEFQEDIRKLIGEILHAYFDDPTTRRRLILEVENQLRRGKNAGMREKTLGLLVSGSRNTLDRTLQRIPDIVQEFMARQGKIGTSLHEHLENQSDTLEQAMAHTLHEMIDQVDIYQLLRSQLTRFDEGKMEEMLWNATNQQLLYIQYLGGFLGILGGLILWQPTFMVITFIVLGAIFFALDVLLMRLQTSKSTST